MCPTTRRPRSRPSRPKPVTIHRRRLSRRPPGTVSRNPRTPVSDIREELMPRSFFRLSALSALVALVWCHASARAQDANKVAADATKNVKEIQKKLAAGKTADDKDEPLLKHLRVDGFTADGDKVKVTGVFIDPGAKPDGDASQ